MAEEGTEFVETNKHLRKPLNLKTLMIVTISCLALAHKASVTHALDIHE